MVFKDPKIGFWYSFSYKDLFEKRREPSMKKQLIGILICLLAFSAIAQPGSYLSSKDTISTEQKLLRFVNERIKLENEKRDTENKKLLAEQLENRMIIERQRFQNYAL